MNTLHFLAKYGLYQYVKCFADNNPLKWNTKLEGKDVFSCETSFAGYKDELVLISCGEGDEISHQLMGYSIPIENIYVPDINTIRPTDPQYISDHIKSLSFLYSMLCDEKSRDVLVGLLNYRMRHDPKILLEIADKSQNQYFDKDLITYSKDDVFLDCGGYTGDTVEEYAKHSAGVYNKVICLEADEDNCKIIKGKAAELKIDLREVACWSEKKQLFFDKVGSGSGNVVAGNKESERQTITVNADTIDHIVSEQKIRFIKMDIEGAEYDALMGARNTIERDKPILMISIYHKQDDFVKLPMLILSMCPEYNLYMRHYRCMSAQETILYALP